MLLNRRKHNTLLYLVTLQIQGPIQGLPVSAVTNDDKLGDVKQHTCDLWGL